jgi:hypothetical protein
MRINPSKYFSPIIKGALTLPVALVTFILVGCIPTQVEKSELKFEEKKERPGRAKNFNKVSKALTVIREKCATCHVHTQWNSYSDKDFVDSGYVVLGRPESSSILLLTKYNPYTQVWTMPKVNNGFSEEDYKILDDWIKNLTQQDLTTENTDNNNQKTGNRFLRGSNDSVKIGGSKYISSLLLGIYGPDSKTTIDTYIDKKRSIFGGICGPYDCVPADGTNYDMPQAMGQTALSEAWRIKTCKYLNFTSNTALYARNLLASGIELTQPPTDAHLAEMYNLFYTKDQVPSEVLTELKAIRDSAKTNLDVEKSWVFPLYTLCVSPQWLAI